MGLSIVHFMWEYQHTFKIEIEVKFNSVLKAAGFDGKSKVFLIGVKAPSSAAHFPICLWPEDGSLPFEIFSGINEEIESNIPNHPMQNVIFGDKPSMDDLPENIRKLVVRDIVTKRLVSYSEAKNLEHFVSFPQKLNDYHVCAVAFLPIQELKKWKKVQVEEQDRYSFDKKTYEINFIDFIATAIMQEAARELSMPQPGRFHNLSFRDDQELLRTSAKNFVSKVASEIDVVYSQNLFRYMCSIAELFYERNEGFGKIIFDKSKEHNFFIEFENEIPLSNFRWSRKILEACNEGFALLADCQNICGIIDTNKYFNETSYDILEVQFYGYGRWQMHQNGEPILGVSHGMPTLVKPTILEARFKENLELVFDNENINIERIWQIYSEISSLNEGCMIIVSEDAESESRRLLTQGMKIVPTELEGKLLGSVSKIDGTVMLGLDGKCYGIGYILDGLTNDACKSERGSRYNSAIRYIKNSEKKRLAVVFSEDRTLDIVPLLPPKQSSQEIELAIENLEGSNLENFHEYRNFLDLKRFYLSQYQCDRINIALERINNLPRDPLMIHWETEKFEVNPDMSGKFLF